MRSVGMFLFLFAVFLLGAACAEDDMGRRTGWQGDEEDLRKLLDLKGGHPGQMGQAQTVPPGGRVTLLQNHAEDNDIELVTLYMQAVPDVPLPGTQRFLSNGQRVVFVVTFGVHGASYTVHVTPKQGAALTMAASSVDVVAENEAAPALPVRAIAALAYGAGATGATFPQATYDEIPFQLAAAGSRVFNPPPFARGVTVMTDNTNGVRFTQLNFVGTNAAVNIGRVNGAAAGISFFDNVPLPDQTLLFSVVNNDAVAARYSVSWLLGI